MTVTGTNGKTTTAHLLAAIARRDGLEPVANRSGSNLERGLASTYVDEARLDGRLDDESRRLGVFEIDEAAWPGLLTRLRPRVALFLNLFRDQLDRYGEVDSVAEGWRHALIGDASGLTLVLNADDPSVAQLADAARGEVVAFGIDDPAVALPDVEHAADARFCACGALFAYDAVYLGHVGVWRCDRCGRRPPALDVRAQRIALEPDGARFALVMAGRTVEVALPLAGLYSVYNGLAAAAGALALGLDGDAITDALTATGPAFGRQERFRVDGREVRVLLAKNPAGMNGVLRTLTSSPQPLHLLAILNDGIQDGHDVSWILRRRLRGTGRTHRDRRRLRHARPRPRVAAVPGRRRVRRRRARRRAGAGAGAGAHAAGRPAGRAADVHGDAERARGAGPSHRRRALLAGGSGRR